MRTPHHSLIQRAARSALQNLSNAPVRIVPGDVTPHWEGEPGYWTTPSGRTIVHSPSAYRWPTVYHHSTRHIVVGRGWARRQRLRLDKGKLFGATKRIHGCAVKRQYTREGVLYIVCRKGQDPYHTWGRRGSPAIAVRQAVQAWRQQRRYARQVEEHDCFVSIEDSVKAGNCRYETERFARKVWSHIQAQGPCAVRASAIVGLRADSHVQRAIVAAQSRSQELRA